jgi:hypothetical protein
MKLGSASLARSFLYPDLKRLRRPSGITSMETQLPPGSDTASLSLLRPRRGPTLPIGHMESSNRPLLCTRRWRVNL